MSLNDKKALRAMKYGSSDALGWIIDRYTAYVNTVIYNIIGSSMTPLDIEEVTSDVFLALWENTEKADAEKLKAYLGSIARSKAKNKLRELGKDVYLEDDVIVVSDDTPEFVYEKQEQELLVRRAVKSMRYPDNEIFLRHYYYYQTVAVIAEEMEMNVSTVKTRLSRGREKLKNALCKGGYLDENKDFRPFGQHT